MDVEYIRLICAREKTHAKAPTVSPSVRSRSIGETAIMRWKRDKRLRIVNTNPERLEGRELILCSLDALKTSYVLRLK